MCLEWGIRGQFGGETGAMVPGAIVGLALAMLSGWRVTGLLTVPPPRATAWYRRWDDLTILLWLVPTLAVELDVSWAEGLTNLP